MGGIFGVVSLNDCLEDLFYGTDYHSHLGTRRGGMVVRTEGGFKRKIHDITNTPFRTKFEEDLPKMHGRLGIGVISDFEDQPLEIGSHHGVYALATVGRINNVEALYQQAVTDRTAHFSEIKGGEINPTELVATLINRADTIPEGIRQAQERIDGSLTILLLTDTGIYAARDLYGRTPLAVGRKAGSMAVSLESCAFPNLEYEKAYFPGPGEIVHLSADKMDVVLPALSKMQICSFMWVYYGFPASTYEGQNAERVRNRCGAALARADEVTVDAVAGIPDSGVGHAVGYANEARIPYQRPFVKYTPTWPRSFMPQDQTVRNLVAKMKLIPIEELIDGQRLLFCEDSIVRGTQLKDIVKRLFTCGAREVHMRAACPPLIYGCPFLNFSRSRSELDLAARRAIAALEGDHHAHLEEYADPDSPRYAAMVAWITENLGLTSVRYQRLDDMIAAIGLPKEKLCTYCWTGKDPSTGNK